MGETDTLLDRFDDEARHGLVADFEPFGVPAPERVLIMNPVWDVMNKDERGLCNEERQWTWGTLTRIALLREEGEGIEDLLEQATRSVEAGLSPIVLAPVWQDRDWSGGMDVIARVARAKPRVPQGQTFYCLNQTAALQVIQTPTLETILAYAARKLGWSSNFQWPNGELGQQIEKWVEKKLNDYGHLSAIQAMKEG